MRTQFEKPRYLTVFASGLGLHAGEKRWKKRRRKKADDYRHTAPNDLTD